MTDWVLFSQNLLAAGVARAIPMLYAGTGELLAERSGVLNLGLEGMMLLGAVAGVGTAHFTGSVLAGLLVAGLAGGLLALVHGFLTITLAADQVVSGLSLVFLGTGLAAVLGAPLVQLAGGVPQLGPVPIPLLSSIPFLGPILFNHNLLVYLGFFLPVALHLFLTRTRGGLALRALGENPAAAAAMGIRVNRSRYIYVALGGFFAGLGGASLSLAITPGWVEGMVAGQGWIALGLVIFARWNPISLALGAVLFGVVRRLPLDLQGTDIPMLRDPDLGYFLNMLPYLLTILILVLSVGLGKGRSQAAPASLGRSFKG